MKQAVFYLTYFIGAITFGSCKKALNVEVTKQDVNVLVVEGLINVADSTKIKLSKTVTVGNKITANPEVGATVSIENGQATIATLKEIVKGTYATPVLNLNTTQKYRLRIKLANGKVYLSDLTETKVTPAIDSVGYTVKSDGVQIYANTHDDTDNSRYYLYNYTDTWKFKTKYNSLLIYDKVRGVLRDRTDEESLWECFASAPSTNIVINSTAALTRDIAYQTPILFISGSAEKISIRYTILVTQTAITKEAYAFWENMKKTTESLGSIFDAQPSQLLGNIHNVANPDEPVIGYISAATTRSKRIFIDKNELPPTFKLEYPFACEMSSIGGSYAAAANFPYTVLYYDEDEKAYKYTNRSCGDCTVRGTLKKPAFWK